MGKIQASIILEILGRPKEHVAEALATLVTRLGAEKGVKILEKTVHEPTKGEKTKDLFTSFAEIDLEFETIGNLFGILFAYMPSNVEVVSPEKLTLSHHDLNEIGNTLVQRLHNYDAITKRALVERDIIVNNLKEKFPDAFNAVISNPSGKPEEEKKN